MTLQLQIEKLKGLDNYKAWSMTMRAYLESEDLWTVVENGPENNEEVAACPIYILSSHLLPKLTICSHC